MAARTEEIIVTLTSRDPGTSAFRWLCTGLRAAILGGRLRPGDRLPATRVLAGRYGLARGTIVTAYEQLKAEGYLEARVGAGSYVAATLPDALLHASSPHIEIPQPVGRRRLSAAARRATLFPATTDSRTRAFCTNQPALDLFPMTIWAQVAGRRLRRATVDQLRVGDPRGYAPLRAAIADYLSASRGVVCTPEQIVVVSGVQEALDLTARVFLDPGDRVCVEHPGYIGASLTFAALGAMITRLPVDPDGMVVRPLRGRPPRLIYVTPAHQFPLGVTMTVTRRLALLEWARRSSAVILEDDYDSEYRYSGAPVPALQGLDRYGLVFYTGSFSKVLFPSLRLGYLVVPTDLVDRVAAMKSIANRCAPSLDQAVLTDFLVEGHFGRHVRRMRAVYAERLGVLLESAAQRLSGWLEFSPVEAGLQTTAWLAGNTDSIAVAEAAARRGVEVTPVSRRAQRQSMSQGLVVGFAAVEPAEIRRGVRDLAAAFEECQKTRSQGPPTGGSTPMSRSRARSG